VNVEVCTERIGPKLNVHPAWAAQSKETIMFDDQIIDDLVALMGRAKAGSDDALDQFCRVAGTHRDITPDALRAEERYDLAEFLENAYSSKP